MQILICCATSGELKTVKAQIKTLHLKQNLDINYLCTGIGSYETIFALTSYFLSHPESDFFLVNIGVCGYRNLGEKRETLIQVGRIKNIHTGKEQLPPIPFIFGKIESLYSSETPLLEPGNEEIGFVDMESWALEFVANKFKIPRLFLKVPFDRVGRETQTFDKEEACRVLASAIDYKKLIEDLLRREGK